MSDENKKETQGQEIPKQEAENQGTQKQETSLSEHDLKQVSGGGTTSATTLSDGVHFKYDIKAQKEA